MDTSTFDFLTRFAAATATRRSALRGLAAGTAATMTVGSLLPADEAAARKKKKNKKTRKRKQKPTQSETPTTPPENVCKAKNWCVDRTQTCGPSGGYGKCLVEATGGNLCAEILFQVKTCAECEAPSCTNCQCVLAAGGGDRCNNGATGYDYICVRAV